MGKKDMRKGTKKLSATEIALLRQALAQLVGEKHAKVVLSDSTAKRLTTDPRAIKFMKLFATTRWDVDRIGELRVWLSNEMAEEYLTVWPELAEYDVRDAQIFNAERDIEDYEERIRWAEKGVTEMEVKLSEAKVRLRVLRKATKPVMAPVAQEVSP